jgi:hypothetical protein
MQKNTQNAKIFIVTNICLYKKPLDELFQSFVILYKDPSFYEAYNFNPIRKQYFEKCLQYYHGYLKNMKTEAL